VHLEYLPEDCSVLVPAYLGHPYLHEDTGYNPEYAPIRYSFDGLDPRNGTSVEYGRAQVEGILSRFGELIAEFVETA
jgi:hypothetical protein